MGALHAGHLSLVKAALDRCDTVAVSIFVNPTQFGPNEDFSRYPRTFDEDCRLLKSAGVDFVFAPSVAEMYPEGAKTWVDAGEISERLDGRSRPGHFRGVATAVAKLLNIFTPEQIFFGQKDAAQVAVLRQMVRDLHFDVDLRMCEIVRDPDGLALSSRNRYLSESERRQALAIPRSLQRVNELIASGKYSSQKLIAEGLAVLGTEQAVRLDYFSVVNPDTLEDVTDVHNGALIAVAAWVGTTRLIDNLLIGKLT
jgi:pantoate--beta-alanine ligase